MWIIKMVLQAFMLFAVPVVILTLYVGTVGINNSKATSIDVFRAYGPFLVVTGLFYVAFGVFLWSPLPKQLLMGLVSRHLNG